MQGQIDKRPPVVYMQNLLNENSVNYKICALSINKCFRGIEDAWPWRHAWQWREGELFLIVEDDAELSKHWYQHLVLISNSVDTAAMLPGTAPWSTCGPSTGSTPACPVCRWSTRGSPSPTARTPSRISPPWSGEAMQW